jgi:glycogen operon protein
VRFVRRLIDLRRSRLWLRRDTFLKGARRGAGARDITWLHPSGREMTDADWNDRGLCALAVLMSAASAPGARADERSLLIAFNAGDSGLQMTLPAASTHASWRVLFDTAANDDDCMPATLPIGAVFTVCSRSTVLLESQDS